MRRIPFALLALLTACSSQTDDVDRAAAIDRPAPDPLLVGADELAGRGLETAENGPWRVRRVASAAGSALTEGVTAETRARGEAPREDAAASWGAEPSDGAPSPRALAAEPEAPTGTDRLAVEHFDDDAAAGVEEAGELFEKGEADVHARRELAKDAALADAAPLRAGTTDDNADHLAFCDWLDGLAESGQLKGRYLPMDVRDRRAIQVVDAAGAPVTGAHVTVVDETGDRVAWRGTTYGDGSVPFFPGLATAEGQEPPATWLVEVRDGERFTRQHWNLDGPTCTVRLAGDAAAASELALDVVFLIDTTGSMGDEIERVKQTLKGVTDKLDGLDREFSLRYGAVLYRDVTDDYVTAAHPFTTDLGEFADALQEIEANGGGDTPESLNQGLAVAVDAMEWRDGAAKLVFLIADAPPHLDYEGDVPYSTSCLRAVSRGIKVHAVAASGLDEAGSAVFRQVAHLTRGKFIFIEYGGNVAASGEAHGVSGVKKSNNLDDILFEQIRDEIAGWGRS